MPWRLVKDPKFYPSLPKIPKLPRLPRIPKIPKIKSIRPIKPIAPIGYKYVWREKWSALTISGRFWFLKNRNISQKS